MSDLKSKLPDLKELGEITGKLVTDLKKSVNEIIHNYKRKRASTEEKPAAHKKPSEKTTKTTAAKEDKESPP